MRMSPVGPSRQRRVEVLLVVEMGDARLQLVGADEPRAFPGFCSEAASTSALSLIAVLPSAWP